ncbi:MAG: hypothetical protein KJ935_05545, partial [Candidatus Omnitrophica bacterium]|nr:hypothetical protein [Candidatus Omnitrophota bacterium]
MKAYLLSVSFHLLFGACIFFLAVSPGKTLPPGRIDQVFLVAEAPPAPVSPVSVGAPFMAPAGSMNRAPTIKPEKTIEPAPIKPEVSLAEKLASRLGSAAPEVWNPKTVTRPEKPRERSVTST